ETLFVRVRSRSGHVGWGESGADAIMAGETLAGMVAMIEQHLRTPLLGASPFDHDRLETAFSRVYANGGAKSAVLMAVLDLAGKLGGKPVVELLGGAVRRRALVLRVIGGSADLDADVAEALALQREGFRAFKLKVGVAELEREIETVAALRRALGPTAAIAVDANMAWDVASARRFARGVAAFAVNFIEQPVASADFEGLAQVAEASPAPVGADEAVHGDQDIERLAARGGASGLSLKAAKFGGLAALVRAATLAQARGLRVNLAMLVESPLATAAIVHAACALPAVDWGVSLGSLWVSESPAVADLESVGGEVIRGDGPGLGVTVDEGTLRGFMAPGFDWGGAS
ncbi:MAG: enolase C-terminal domain-like protein, partial [Beijerinckiaceae bacterium]|nr:enolase C-terminal domain-like protein [Beijerinckiaceae bacterium]